MRALAAIGWSLALVLGAALVVLLRAEHGVGRADAFGGRENAHET